MDRLILLYEQMKKLRETGVRMKDISEETNIASSVLSSLYSSVLPVYVNLRSNGEDPEKSLDQALQQVNNVSGKLFTRNMDANIMKLMFREDMLNSNVYYLLLYVNIQVPFLE